MLSSGLFHQLFNAIVYLHCNYIVHTNLKLDNVLLTEDSGKLMTKLADLRFSESIVRGDKIAYFSSYKGTKKGYVARRFMRTYMQVDYTMERKLIYLR